MEKFDVYALTDSNYDEDIVIEINEHKYPLNLIDAMQLSNKITSAIDTKVEYSYDSLYIHLLYYKPNVTLFIDGGNPFVTDVDIAKFTKTLIDIEKWLSAPINDTKDIHGDNVPLSIKYIDDIIYIYKNNKLVSVTTPRVLKELLGNIEVKIQNDDGDHDIAFIITPDHMTKCSKLILE